MNKIYNLTKKQQHSSPNTCNTIHAREDKYIDGNITKYNNLHMQESFDIKVLTLANFT